MTGRRWMVTAVAMMTCWMVIDAWHHDSLSVGIGLVAVGVSLGSLGWPESLPPGDDRAWRAIAVLAVVVSLMMLARPLIR